MGETVNFMQLQTLWPFPDDDVKAFVEENDHVYIVENSYTGQIGRLIRHVVGPIDKLHDVRKYNGRPFRPIEIIDAVRTGSARQSGGSVTMALVMSPKDFATATPSWWCPGCGDFGVLASLKSALRGTGAEPERRRVRLRHRLLGEDLRLPALVRFPRRARSRAAGRNGGEGCEQ